MTASQSDRQRPRAVRPANPAARARGGRGRRAKDVDVVLLEPASADARRTLAAVRARNQNVYVICASVYPKEEASIEADAFLVKPVSLAALRSALPSGRA